MEKTIKNTSIEELMDDFFNKKERTKFYKKELFLIGIMAFSLLSLLFYRNGWDNKLTFISLFVVLSVVALKLLLVFNERIKYYNSFIVALENEIKETESIAASISPFAEKLVGEHASSGTGFVRILEYISKVYQQGDRKRAFKLIIAITNSSAFDDVGGKEAIDFIPVLEYNEEGETRYSLDDYVELENQLTVEKTKDEEFEPKIVDEELLKERADERRKKLKDWNYKFQTSLANIDEIEPKPTYKRQGVNLNEPTNFEFLIFLDETFNSYIKKDDTSKINVSLVMHIKSFMKKREFSDLDDRSKRLYEIIFNAVSRSEKTISK